MTKPETKSVFKSQENNDFTSLLGSKNTMFRTMHPKNEHQNKNKNLKISKKLFLGNDYRPKRNQKIKHNRVNNLDLMNLGLNTITSSRIKSNRSRTPSRKHFSIKTDRI